MPFYQESFLDFGGVGGRAVSEYLKMVKLIQSSFLKALLAGFQMFSDCTVIRNSCPLVAFKCSLILMHKGREVTAM